MRFTTLTTTLLLTAAARVSAAVLPFNRMLPGLAVGPNSNCDGIHARVLSARSLHQTADTNITAIPHSIISARDPPPEFCGILSGNQRSAYFTLDPNTKWNGFWVIFRYISGGQHFAPSLVFPKVDVCHVSCHFDHLH